MRAVGVGLALIEAGMEEADQLRRSTAQVLPHLTSALPVFAETPISHLAVGSSEQQQSSLISDLVTKEFYFQSDMLKLKLP